MKPNDFAKELIRRNGLQVARRIANTCANAPTDAQLPSGPVFFPTEPKGAAVEAERQRKRNRGFWEHISGILKKA